MTVRILRFLLLVLLSAPAYAEMAWVLGDPGTGNQGQLDVRDAWLAWNGGPPDLLVSLGDNAYPDGTLAEYQANFFGVYAYTLATTPVYPAFGNHDDHSADAKTQTGPYFDIFGRPPWYSFDTENVHWVVLDSATWDHTANGALQQWWLAADLAATNKPWTIVYHHVPPYTKGSHDSDVEFLHIRVRENWGPIIEAAGVDLVLTGHSHAYERTCQIRGHFGTSDTFDPATMLVADGGHFISGKGTVYAVMGSSGSVAGGPLGHPAMCAEAISLGSLGVRALPRSLNVTMIDDQGTVRDEFVIKKHQLCGLTGAEPLLLLWLWKRNRSTGRASG